MGKSQSKETTSDEEKHGNHARFALVGSSGCGKSAFVNAVRGYGRTLIVYYTEIPLMKYKFMSVAPVESLQI
jgi:ABC-type glutathione transport system ATPase component